tara:strand:+ start:159 stop:635 length:477 start_codon:yes stop_codon:yes gene_type:complete
MANWGKIYCSTWWGDDSNKDSLSTSQFEQCGIIPPVGYTPPTNLTITELVANTEYQAAWVNTAFTGTIETLQIWIQKEGLPSPNILPVAFDPNKPTSRDFNFQNATPGNYTVRVQYSDPTNGLSGFSNTVSFSTIPTVLITQSGDDLITQSLNTLISN